MKQRLQVSNATDIGLDGQSLTAVLLNTVNLQRLVNEHYIYRFRSGRMC